MATTATHAIAVLTDAFSRIEGHVHGVLDGIDPADLAHRPGGTGNSIAWLVWHLTRVQDDHVAGVAGTDQVWTAQGWAERFGLSLPVRDTGYGHDSAAVDALGGATAALLRGYFDATHAATSAYLATVTADDLDRVVDRRWDPPVTLAVRLVSVVDDDAQHAGQAAYVRGLLTAGVRG